MNEPIDARAVLTLAHAQGHAWVDEQTARRIAAAATTAVQAVGAAAPAAQPVLLEQSAGEFAAMLEALAESDS
jgi:hypothetical protein